MKQQSSIEWLESRIKVLIPNDIGSQLMFKNNIKKAKEIFEQEIIKAYEVGNNDYANFSYVATSGVDYYAIKFKDENDRLNKEE